ncbi:hypothetical protein [Desulfobacula sp.]|uniref:hypothetical protein n=1 Tax=Desulfobacula sp. TaxID=2593537 RepID=UPI0026219FD5|nr:hypothetical protein [Desulfobacula sp.]
MRENFTSGSDGEGLETGLEKIPRQSFTRQVFFEDWKGHEGWGRLTKQPGDEGSDRSLILNLLVDHCFFFHPDQLAFLENNLPACTVGSLVSKIKVECLVAFIQEIACDERP